MGIAALGFCSFEGTHCTQVVIQHNATPPLLGDFGKSSIYNTNVQECDARMLHSITKAGYIKITKHNFTVVL